MLYNPLETSECRALLSNYACKTFLTYPIKQTSHLLLWDFKGLTNIAAQNYMRELNLSFSLEPPPDRQSH